MQDKGYNNPRMQILTEQSLEKLHCASLTILKETGVTIDCDEALMLLAEAGADVSDSKGVKIPSRLVEEALKSTPETITLFDREGNPCIFLDRKHTYFGANPDNPDILDPYSHERRLCYVEDVASLVRLIDFLPNISWVFTSFWAHGIPGEISDRVVFVQALLNTSKPVGPCINDVASLRAMLDVCSIVTGGLETLCDKPFFYSTVEPVTPLVQGKDALEKSLLCAELMIPNVIYSMPMAGATSPATFAGTLAVCNAEILSHLVVTQLKNPGAPIIYGSMPNIMDMRTTIYPYGAPELNLLTACLAELSHYYKLPFWGTAGVTDAKVVGIQASAELMYQCLTSFLSGADFVHDTGLMDHSTMISPELIVLMDEIIEMAKVFIQGLEINEQTLALDLVHSVGPGGCYIDTKHTLEHFRNFWVPSILDRTRLQSKQDHRSTKQSEELLKEKTIRILETHEPEPLPEDKVKEIRKLEESWFKSLGLNYEYLKYKK